MGGPLAGVRVVELAGLGPVPHGAMELADLGADVVRIVRPDAGPGLLPTEGDLLGRGRRVLEIDLKARPAELLQLVAKADVLVEGFRPGVMERLGLGPDRCLDVNPRLVFARMTGWGQDGPLASRAGHDLNYLSVTGSLAAMARPGEPPRFPMNLVADFGGGSMLLVVGILAALVERASSGLGQVIDVAMVDGVALLSQMMWSLRGQGWWTDEPGTNLLDGGAPFYDVYACADGRYVAVAPLEPQFYAELLDGLGLDPARLPDQNDRSGWPVLREIFTKAFATRRRDEWTEIFSDRDACVTPVVEPAEAAEHPQLAARRTMVTVDGRLQAAPAPRFERTPTDPPRPSTARRTTVGSVLDGWT
jgi:alpha-methylacyl-CoA racemase